MKTFRLYEALLRREIELEKTLECVGEGDKFYHLYELELNEVRKALCQIEISVEI